CLKYAYQNSEKLKIAELAVEQARCALKQATAGLWPTLGYEIYRARTGRPDMEYDTDYKGLKFSQNLYTGGKLNASIKQARLRLENALEDQRQVKQQLANDVKQAYYQMWLALQKLTVAQASYDNMGKHFSNVDKKYQEGMIPKIDLLQAQVNWRKLKPEVISAQNEVSLCRSNLALLIGKQNEKTLLIELESLMKITPQTVTTSFDNHLGTAYRERPEMRELINNIEIAKLGVVIAQADYYPKVALSGSEDGNKNDLSPDWSESWTLTADLSGTLFNGFATRQNVASAKMEVAKQLSREKQLKDEIRLKLEQVLQTLEESIETIEVNQANCDLAKESLRLTQIKLDEGLATNTDLLDAQLDVDEALNGYYNGIYNYLAALANLDLVLGKDFY
ncbi:MAG TPA: TolC family protein, partial [Bacillota bacterium]|nr:TolC family protein [Bacillota bacterium]